MHRLAGDRRWRRRRGPARDRCTPSSSTRPRTRWAARNLAGTGVDLRLGDLATAFDDLAGSVDVVVCNPPYIPLEAWESVAAEARDHDPHLALFSGDDGLDAIRVLERRRPRCCGPGEWSAPSTPTSRASPRPAVFAATGRWTEVRDHLDLAGRPRYLTARLARMSPACDG